jgi:alpha-L-fucosidase
VLEGQLTNLGGVKSVEVGFQYRVKKDGTDLSERTEPWVDLPTVAQTGTGNFSYALGGLAANREYEFRAMVKHPLLTLYGQERTFRTAGR